MNKVIYIVLTETKTLLSRVIQLYTQQDFSHISIAFDPELQEMYSFGRKRVNNPFIGGFVHEDPTTRILREASCAIYVCPVTDEQYTMLKNTLHHYKKNKNNYKYNFIGLFGVACRLKVRRDNAFFCSQFIATLFKQVGLPLYGKCPYFMKPCDFVDFPYLEFIYAGKLENYSSFYETKSHQNIPVSSIQSIA